MLHSEIQLLLSYNKWVYHQSATIVYDGLSTLWSDSTQVHYDKMNNLQCKRRIYAKPVPSTVWANTAPVLLFGAPVSCSATVGWNRKDFQLQGQFQAMPLDVVDAPQMHSFNIMWRIMTFYVWWHR